MSIPMDRIVKILPSAIGTGGNPLALNTLLITETDAPLVGARQFGSANEVGGYFGLTSDEYKFAQRYFLGYDGATRVPSALFITKKSTDALPAQVVGASVRGLTLDQLKAITGELSITVNGTKVDLNLDFGTVTSFSDAAAMLTDVDNFVGEFEEQQQAFIIKTIGTNTTATISFATGDAADALKLTQDAGAQKENARSADNIEDIMRYALSQTQNFGVFAYLQEQDREVMEASAIWNTLQDGRFAYVAQDTEADALVANGGSSFGEWVFDTEQNGTTPYYGGLEQIAALCGGIAAIDFKRTNGRRNMMFMKQSGLPVTVTEEAEYTALMANGYTFYAQFATANDKFSFVTNGAVSGHFKWLDNYVNQIYMNAQLQLAMATMLVSYGSIPYNEVGKAYHRSAAQDPINEMVNFGGIVPLVDPSALSEQQKSIINSQAGYDIVPTLLSQGWALDIKTADAQTRGLRGSMPFTLWYTDGGSVQQVNLASINVQ